MAATIHKFERRETKDAKAGAAGRGPVSGARFEALDILRGLFIIGMLIANNAGDWAHIYPQFDHAEWHGFTLTDMVFPGFMVCVGISMTLSLGRRMGDGGKGDMAFHIVRRALILVAIGVFLNALPGFDLAHLRLPGVLQRIGLCYAIAAMLVLLHSHKGADGTLIVHPRALAFWAVGLLVGYAVVLKFIPVPGFGANRFDSEGSWPAYVDRIVPGIQHIWQQGLTNGRITYDPEGILSTPPATFNILAGLLIGLYIKSKTPREAVAGVAITGIVLMVLALALDGQIPIIKKLWTPSFALLTSGFAMTLLSVLMLIMDRLGFKTWAMPIRVLGTNAILAYVFAWLLSIALEVTGLGALATNFLHARIQDPYLMSFVFALMVLGIVWLVVLPFYLKKIFLKI